MTHVYKYGLLIRQKVKMAWYWPSSFLRDHDVNKKVLASSRRSVCFEGNLEMTYHLIMIKL